MTAALPCFVDLESDQPHLMGAVALDIALSAKGEAVWRTLLPWLQGLLQPAADHEDAPVQLEEVRVLEGHERESSE